MFAMQNSAIINVQLSMQLSIQSLGYWQITPLFRVCSEVLGRARRGFQRVFRIYLKSCQPHNFEACCQEGWNMYDLARVNKVA